MVDSRGEIGGVAHVAFVHPDGSKSLVLSNTGEMRTVQVRVGNAATQVALPMNSLTNLKWS